MCPERDQLVKDLEHWEDPSTQVLEHLPNQFPQSVGGNNINRPKAPGLVRKKFANDTGRPKNDFTLVSEACRLCSSPWMEPGTVNTPMDWLHSDYDQTVHVDS